MRGGLVGRARFVYSAPETTHQAYALSLRWRVRQRAWEALFRPSKNFHELEIVSPTISPVAPVNRTRWTAPGSGLNAHCRFGYREHVKQRALHGDTDLEPLWTEIKNY